MEKKVSPKDTEKDNSLNRQKLKEKAFQLSPAPANYVSLCFFLVFQIPQGYKGDFQGAT